MSDGKKIFWGALAALAVLGVVVWAIWTVPEPPSLDDAPHIMRYEGNTLRMEKNGRTVWQLTAEAIEANADGKTAEARNIEGVFHEEGRELRLTAPHAVYHLESKDLMIDGGVEIRTTDGVALTSREVVWTDAQGTLAAVGDAVLTQAEQGLRVTAERIESKDGFQKFTAKGKDGKKAHIEKGSGEK